MGRSAIKIRTIVTTIIHVEPYHNAMITILFYVPHFLTLPYPSFVSFRQLKTTVALFLILTRIPRHMKENVLLKLSVTFLMIMTNQYSCRFWGSAVISNHLSVLVPLIHLSRTRIWSRHYQKKSSLKPNILIFLASPLTSVFLYSHSTYLFIYRRIL